MILIELAVSENPPKKLPVWLMRRRIEHLNYLSEQVYGAENKALALVGLRCSKLNDEQKKRNLIMSKVNIFYLVGETEIEDIWWWFKRKCWLLTKN